MRMPKTFVTTDTGRQSPRDLRASGAHPHRRLCLATSDSGGRCCSCHLSSSRYLGACDRWAGAPGPRIPTSVERLEAAIVENSLDAGRRHGTRADVAGSAREVGLPQRGESGVSTKHKTR